MKRRLVTNIISRSFGKFASHRFHPTLQKFINRSYVRLLGLDMDEFEDPESYESLNALFTRPLMKSRVLEEDLISPTDSLVTECGKMQGNKALQIKGMVYDVDRLLSECDASSIHGGTYVNLYLSPRDYHRYHVPVDMRVRRVVHVPGKLYPVNLRYLRKKLDLFIENERVILECETMGGGRFFIVLVGALNVGKMTLVFESRIETNHTKEVAIYEYEDLFLKKGDLLGYFKMGSTVLLFFEPGLCELTIGAGTQVRFGQKIGVLHEKQSQ